jgi:hypothetical protein
MEPQGICLVEKAHIVFPDGVSREGSVWQHTDGARSIYAAVLYEDGYVFYHLSPQWVVTSREGYPVYQGM